MKKFFITLFLLFLIPDFCFSVPYIKQNDEYTCGPVSSYNLIRKMCPSCKDYDVSKLVIIQKTDNNGTTSYNLCNGLDKYFKSQNINADIRYYGIKKLRKYKANSDIDFKEISGLIKDGHSAILNIGVYTKDTDGSYTRQCGHYVNLISVNNNEIKVSDPYDKTNDYSYWKFKSINTKKVYNINDNEKYIKTDNYNIIISPISYLEKNEFALINGIIVINNQ